MKKISISFEEKDLSLSQKVYYYGVANYVQGKVDEFKKDLRGSIEKAVAVKGIETGKSKKLDLDTGKITLTIKEKVSVKDEAINILEKKGLSEFIEKEYLIEVKENVRDIPKKVLEELNKYFDITERKSVDKKTLEFLKEKGKLTEKEYESLVDKKEIPTLRIDLKKKIDSDIEKVNIILKED